MTSPDNPTASGTGTELSPVEIARAAIAELDFVHKRVLGLEAYRNAVVHTSSGQFSPGLDMTDRHTAAYTEEAMSEGSTLFIVDFSPTSPQLGRSPYHS